MIGFIIGLFLGCFLGVMVMCILYSASETDKHLNKSKDNSEEIREKSEVGGIDNECK